MYSLLSPSHVPSRAPAWVQAEAAEHDLQQRVAVSQLEVRRGWRCSWLLNVCKPKSSPA